MPADIRVAVLDDHQSVIDGYRFRLANHPNIEVVAAISFGSDLEALLRQHPVEVVILDINVPAAPDNPTVYPILHVIPKLVEKYPNLVILVISMLTERALVQAILKAGASGYILKDDRAAIEQLGPIIQSAMAGEIYVSESIRQKLGQSQEVTSDLLTGRQLEVLSLAAAHPDWSRTALANELNISPSTARNLLSGAYLRLNVPNLMTAIAKARRLGLLPLAELHL